MRLTPGPVATVAAPTPEGPTGVLQRTCACGRHSVAGGECEECRRKRGGTLERSALAPRGPGGVPPIVHDVLRAPAPPLDRATRARMEERFGHDFGRVRVHTGARAALSAHAVDAAAYTVGSDVVFGAGRYTPGTAAGERLLAHELTHVTQSGPVPAGGPLTVGRADSAEERAAERNEVVGRPASGPPQLRRSVGGFFANIGRAIKDLFGGDADEYDVATLDRYLAGLRASNAIEDDFDSDNKARAVVRARRFQQETLAVRELLIDEMMSGAVYDDDENAILEILKSATAAERTLMAEHVGYEALYKAFDGPQLDELYPLLPLLNTVEPRGPSRDKTWNVEQYIARWEKEHARTLTASERGTLAKGCVGVTALNLGTAHRPDLSECYDSFERALAVQRTMNAALKDIAKDRKALIFSKRFWAHGKDYSPDPKSGRVEMAGQEDIARPEPGMTNFDYGLYDEATGMWWHANHCEPRIWGSMCDRGGRPMVVYESTLQHYSRNLEDFDTQVFCVGVTTVP